MAPKCSLLREPRLLYGYESHPNGIRDKSYSLKAFDKPKVETKPGEPARELTILDPNEKKQTGLRPVLGPHGQPTGQEPDWARR